MNVKPVRILAILVALLAIVATIFGLFLKNDVGSMTVQTARGESVELYGQGLYAYDTLFKAPINRGTDAVMLFLAAPLLILAIVLTKKQTVGRALFLADMLFCFAYYSLSLAFGVVYNALFPVYLLLFASSLWGFILAISGLMRASDSICIESGMPRRGVGIFIIIGGCSVFVWLFEIVKSAVSGMPPSSVAIYTTEVTYYPDLGIIAPAAFASAVMVFRRNPKGYLLGSALIMLNAIVGFVVIAQTIAQQQAGIVLGIGQLIGYVGIFVVMSLFAVYFNIRLFRNIKAQE